MEIQQQTQGYPNPLMTTPDIMIHQTNQYPINSSQSPQFLMQQMQLMPEKITTQHQLGSQVMQGGNGNSVALAAKNGGGYNQKDNPDNI
eukprot:11143250-Ditylum_brightwellii.AAC.1